MSAHRLDLVGHRYGRWIVTAYSHTVSYGHAGCGVWVCRCDCGTERAVSARTLRDGTSRSCGCIQRRPGTGSGAWVSWQCMLTRCTNPNRTSKAKYIDRGITVCERWRLFENFLADMGERPTGTTLDRYPNPKGNYEPGNCRWATPTEQARNRRNSRLTFDQAVEVAKARLLGEPSASIAGRFNCSENLPNEIVKGRCWKDAMLKATLEVSADAPSRAFSF